MISKKKKKQKKKTKKKERRKMDRQLQQEETFEATVHETGFGGLGGREFIYNLDCLAKLEAGEHWEKRDRPQREAFQDAPSLIHAQERVRQSQRPRAYFEPDLKKGRVR